MKRYTSQSGNVTKTLWIVIDKESGEVIRRGLSKHGAKVLAAILNDHNGKNV